MAKKPSSTSRTLFQLSYSGLRKFDRERVDTLYESLVAAQKKPLTKSPCRGGRLLVSRVAWECIGGRFVLVQTDTYQCPDGSFVDVRVVIKRTKDPC